MSFRRDVIRSRQVRTQLAREAQSAPPREKLTGPDLSSETIRRVHILFPHEEDRKRVKELLYERCGNNVSRSESADRLRFSALKYSKGDRARLEKAIQMAELDWRDLLLAAGFAMNPEKHLKWEPKPKR